jgi:DNA repair protein RadC
MGVQIRDLPPSERPRERLWAKGPSALTDRELIALVLRNGREGLSALGLADELLASYGSLAIIAAAHPEELASFPGIGVAKAAALLAACRLGRSLATDEPVKVVRGPEDIAALAVEELGGFRRERVLVVVLDGRNRVRRLVTVTEGKADRAMFPVREILNAVLRNDGAAFALAHNHPSGDLEASPEDIRATQKISVAASTLGVRFLDHVIVGGGNWARIASKSG